MSVPFTPEQRAAIVEIIRDEVQGAIAQFESDAPYDPRKFGDVLHFLVRRVIAQLNSNVRRRD